MTSRRYVFINFDPSVLAGLGAAPSMAGFNVFTQLDIGNEEDIPAVDAYMAARGYLYDDDAGKYLRTRSTPSGTLKSVEVEDDNDVHARDA